VLLAKLAGDAAFTASPAGRDVLRKLALVTGARNQPAEIDSVIAALSATSSVPAKLSVLGGLGDGLKRNKKTLRQAAHGAVDELLTEAYRLAADANAAAADREPAIHLVGLDDLDNARKLLSDLLDSHQPQEVQRAAVAALTATNHKDVGAILLSRWSSYTPPVRADVMNALLGYKPRILALLDAVEKKKVDQRDVPSGKRASLMRHSDQEIRERAQKLFSADPAGDRKAVIERYMSAVDLKGNPDSGHKVYESICIACHRLGDQGNDVGPNLATVRLWSPEQLLVNILDPNREVAPAFTEYTIDTNDGESLSGIIADENASSVTLKWAGGLTRTLARSEIKKITASRLSLMPEGLEANVTVEQMADLIAFLRGQK
jgi:putative heme-binding domain-containing protein